MSWDGYLVNNEDQFDGDFAGSFDWSGGIGDLSSQVQTSNNTYATLTHTFGGVALGNAILCYDIQTATPGDFATGTVNGIEVLIERKASATSPSFIVDAEVYLVKAGSIVGSNKARTNTSTQKWETTDTEYTYGGSADLWGTTWTPAQVSASNFGVWFRPMMYQISGPITGSVDRIYVKIYYTPAGGTVTLSFIASLAQVTPPRISATTTVPRFGQIYPATDPGHIIPTPPTADRLILMADVGVTYDWNTTKVSQWSDQSGNGFHAVQATSANQPTKGIALGTPGGADPGVHYVSFDKAGPQWMQCANTSALNGGTTDFTVVVVGFCRDNASAEQKVFIAKTNNAAGFYGWWLAARRGGANAMWTGMWSNSDGNTTNSYGYDGPTLAVSSGIVWDVLLVEYKRNPNIINIYRNGVLTVIPDTILTNTLGATANIDNSVGYVLGRNPAITNYLSGGIAEIRVHGGIYTATQKKQLHDYLSAKYNKILGGP